MIFRQLSSTLVAVIGTTPAEKTWVEQQLDVRPSERFHGAGTVSVDDDPGDLMNSARACGFPVTYEEGAPVPEGAP
jgi:hypothetical protein